MDWCILLWTDIHVKAKSLQICLKICMPTIDFSARKIVGLKDITQWGPQYKVGLTNSFSSSQYNLVAEVDRVKFAVSFCVYLQHFQSLQSSNEFVFHWIVSLFYLWFSIISKMGIFFPIELVYIYVMLEQRT